MNEPSATKPSVEPPAAVPESHSPSKRPGALSFLLIASLVLGALGTLSSLAGVGTGLFQTRESAIAQAKSSTSKLGKLRVGPRDETLDALQLEMAEAMVAAQWELRPHRIAASAINLVLSAALLVGALLALKRSAKGRSVLRIAAWSHLPYQALYAWVSIATTRASTAASGQFLEKMMEARLSTMPGNMEAAAGKAQDFVRLTSKATSIIGLASAVAVAVALAAFYLWIGVYLGKKAARDYCGE